MLYTTYFAKLSKLPLFFTPVAICVKPPVYFNGKIYSKLAPPYDLVIRYKNSGDEQMFITEYNEKVLSQLDPFVVESELNSFAGSKHIALCCYEKSGDFCHRHLVSQWFNANGISCSELSF